MKQRYHISSIYLAPKGRVTTVAVNSVELKRRDLVERLSKLIRRMNVACFF